MQSNWIYSMKLATNYQWDRQRWHLFPLCLQNTIGPLPYYRFGTHIPKCFSLARSKIFYLNFISTLSFFRGIHICLFSQNLKNLICFCWSKMYQLHFTKSLVYSKLAKWSDIKDYEVNFWSKVKVLISLMPKGAFTNYVYRGGE